MATLQRPRVHQKRVGVTPYTRTVRRATRCLLQGFGETVAFEQVEGRYLELVLI
eukprot:COSAG02_NODE_52525_length_307_cov_0.750000_1_plen_53_part_01